MNSPVYLAGAVRTPIGVFGGALATVPAAALGSLVVRASLARAGMSEGRVDEVLFGNVVGAGLGQNVARQVSIGAGLPVGVGATTVDKVCGSGLKAVMLAVQAIRCGDASVVVAGGTENMSRTPYLLEKARGGYRMGHGELVDSMIRDGLWDVYTGLAMGHCGERCAARFGFTREAQDAYAIESFRRALAASVAGRFADELVPVEVEGGRGTGVVTQDENPGRFDEARLRRLPPAFGKDGTVTAGNASGVNDGAAALLVLSESAVRELGVAPLARVLGYASFAREPEWFTLAPSEAIARLLGKLGRTAADIDLFEINEPFSVVAMGALRDLGIPHERCNVHGGAVALGHPIGASGARILVTLLHALRQRGARTGLAALCIGGGEAVALAVERC